MTKDDALKLVDNDKIAEQLSELYGGNWTVTSEYNEETGELTTIESLSGTVETIHVTLQFPLSAWNDAFNTDKNCAQA